MYQFISSPVDYGGVRLKNRVIFAPTTMGLSREETRIRLRTIARGGCGMIILGDIPAVPFGTEPSLYEPDGFEYYRGLTELIHREGCKVCGQLYLTDSVAEPAKEDKTPRRIPPEELSEYISRLPAQKLEEYIACFAGAARLSKLAGFDMIQVLGDRMLGSFCSTVFNRRKDPFGGSPQNRMRLAAECVRSIRKEMPDFPIDYKLPVRQENPHYGNAGVLLEELPEAVPLLEAAGVSAFHVTLANHCSLGDVIPAKRHPYFGEEGCFLKFCDAVRGYTKLPVCGVGGLTDPDFIERQLAASRVDCVAMSRQLIADPEWCNKVLSGKPHTIRFCVRCNGRCIEGMKNHSGVYCRNTL